MRAKAAGEKKNPLSLSTPGKVEAMAKARAVSHANAAARKAAKIAAIERAEEIFEADVAPVLGLSPQALAKRREHDRKAALSVDGVRGRAGKAERDALKALSVKDLLSPYREACARRIAALALRSKDEIMSFTACRYIYDRTDGPIPKPMEISGKDGAPLSAGGGGEQPDLRAMLAGALVGVALGERDKQPVIEGRKVDDE